MHTPSLTTARNSQNYPKVVSDTRYAYPFDKTPRFLQPNPKYSLLNAAALKPSMATRLNCRIALLGWAMAERPIFRNYCLTILHQIATKSSLSLSHSAAEVSVLAARGRNRRTDHIWFPRSIVIPDPAM